MYTRLQIALWSAAAVFGLAYTDSEAAVRKAPQSPRQKSNGQAHNFGQIVAELHQAKQLLDHANHTYNGHRAKADGEISKAIHVLHPNHAKNGTTTQKKGQQKGQRQKESQQTSDTQLRQAENLVRTALVALQQHQNDQKTQHASRLLHEAMRQIDQAIQAEHKHRQNQAGALIKP